MRAVWVTGQEHRPWQVFDSHDLVAISKALYVVSGAVRSVGGYLDVQVVLYSDIEKKILADWTGQFSPEAASARDG